MSLYYLMTSEHYKWQYIVFHITQTINFEVYIDSSVIEGRDMLHECLRCWFRIERFEWMLMMSIGENGVCSICEDLIFIEYKQWFSQVIMLLSLKDYQRLFRDNIKKLKC